jgi:hypothetical protein
MNIAQLIEEIFDGTFDPDASYFNISEEQRDIIASKLILHNIELFKEDKNKIIFYAEYFKFMRDRATDNDLYETADLYDRLIKKLFQETIDV